MDTTGTLQVAKEMARVIKLASIKLNADLK